MRFFCTCAHDNIKMYEEVIKPMHKLQREVEGLLWLKKAIESGSLKMITRHGEWSFNKKEEANDKKDDDSTLLS